MLLKRRNFVSDYPHKSQKIQMKKMYHKSAGSSNDGDGTTPGKSGNGANDQNW